MSIPHGAVVPSSMARVLGEAIDGPVHRPGDDGYEGARLPWQRRVDQYPALVAEAAGAHDVRAALHHNIPPAP